MTKTSEMTLREYLSTMSLNPKHAEAVDKLFRLADYWRFQHGDMDTDAEDRAFCTCATMLEDVIGAPSRCVPASAAPRVSKGTRPVLPD